MTFSQLITLSLSAILIENFVLVKYLGVCPFIGMSKKMDTAFGMGVAVVFVMTAASACTFAVDRLLVAYDLPALRTLTFILIIAALVQLLEMFLKKVLPSLYTAMGIYLPLITTNCAVLGVALINSGESRDFIGTVVYAASAGVGFLVAIVLFASVRERLEFADYPESFEGFPIALTTAALLSIAFMGFAGLRI